jgi:hypothetical protein
MAKASSFTLTAIALKAFLETMKSTATALTFLPTAIAMSDLGFAESETAQGCTMTAEAILRLWSFEVGAKSPKSSRP